jgi:hypothetical protein
MTFVLDADGSNVRLRQVGVAQGSLTEMSLDGTPGRILLASGGLDRTIP